MKPAYIAFTPDEWAIMCDRLALADDVASAIEEFTDAKHADIVAACERLRHCDRGIIVDNTLDSLILQDCVDSSAALLNLEPGSDERIHMGFLARSIEQKIARHLGAIVHFPRR